MYFLLEKFKKGEPLELATKKYMPPLPIVENLSMNKGFCISWIFLLLCKLKLDLEVKWTFFKEV